MLLVSVYKHSIKKWSTFADEIFQDLQLNTQVCPMFNKKKQKWSSICNWHVIEVIIFSVAMCWKNGSLCGVQKLKAKE